jgi:zinc protease
MLTRGAGELDAAAYAARSEEIANRVGFDAGYDSFTVSARMLTENRDESVELLRLALTEPRFDADAMERARAAILSGIRSQATDPGAIASKTWRKLLFPDDPYGRPVSGTQETVAAITADDLRAARARALNRSRVAIAVVGDITAEELGPLLDRVLGDLPAEDWTPLPPAKFAPVRGVVVKRLDTPQAVARLVQEGLLREDPDFIPAYVMNHILGGGGFSSILTEEVREKRGLTYSVFSYLAPYDRAGILAAGVSSDKARIREAIEVIKAQWARLREEGVTEEQLDAAKRYLTGAYPLRFDSNSKIAGQLAALKSAGFTPDYMERRNGLIEAVTLEDIRRVARRLLDPDRLAVVVVGEPEGMESTIPAPD